MRNSGTTGTPPSEVASVNPNAASMPAYSNQMLFDIHHNMGRMEVTVENLCRQHETLHASFSKESERQAAALTSAVERIERALADKHGAYDSKFSRLDRFVWGFGGFAACITIMAPIFWWLTGERIESTLKGPAASEQSSSQPAKKK